MIAELTGLLLVLTLGLLSPGPDFFLIVKNSLGTSRGRAFGTVAGIATGLAVQTAVISFGFAVALPSLLRSVQIVGAVFLAWVGLRALLGGLDEAADASTPDKSKTHVRAGYVQGLLCNLTNPKAFLFFVSLFAQVLRPGTAAAWRLVLPVAVVVHGGVAWSLVVLAVQSPPVQRRLERAQRWLPKVFGAALIFLAAAVAWEVWIGWSG
jgi:threonine/homoserine/homoserine lactone efflux protein